MGYVYMDWGFQPVKKDEETTRVREVRSKSSLRGKYVGNKFN